MRKHKKAGEAISKAAKSVSHDEVEKPEKQVVTLYLEKEPYLEFQRVHGRKVSQVISKLIKEYLKVHGT